MIIILNYTLILFNKNKGNIENDYLYNMQV